MRPEKHAACHEKGNDVTPSAPVARRLIAVAGNAPEEALRHPDRPPHVVPWVGEVIDPSGGRFEHAWLVSEHSAGRSLIDLTPIHPDVMGQLVEEAHADARDGADPDRVLDLLVNRTRRHDPLVKTRVIGRAPELLLYERTALDPAAYLAEFSRPVDE